MAIGVTWPIIVLNAKDVIAPQETPFRRIAVPKSSAGIAQLNGPLVMKKTANDVSQDTAVDTKHFLPRLKSHVKTTKAQ